jgi:hypothetical protein
MGGDKVKANLRVERAQRFVAKAIDKLAKAAYTNEDGAVSWQTEPLSDKELLVLITGLYTEKLINQTKQQEVEESNG